MVEEIIGRLPELSGTHFGRLEDELRRQRQRTASSEGGGVGATHVQKGDAPPVTEVLEYRPHEDGYLQLELRRYIRRDGSSRERGPYWYFQFHEGGKCRKLYLGKTSDSESILAAKRAEPSGSRLLPSLHTALMISTGSRGDWRMIVGTGGCYCRAQSTGRSPHRQQLSRVAPKAP